MSLNCLHDEIHVGETVRLRSPVVLSTKLSINHGKITRVIEGRRGKTYNVSIGHKQKDLEEVARKRLWKLSDKELMEYRNSLQNAPPSPVKNTNFKKEFNNTSTAPLTPTNKPESNVGNALVTPLRSSTQVTERNTDRQSSPVVTSIVENSSRKIQHVSPVVSVNTFTFKTGSRRGNKL